MKAGTAFSMYLFLSLLCAVSISAQNECPQVCTSICPNSCNSVDEKGYCDLSQGLCVCYGNNGGDDCGTPNGPDPAERDASTFLDGSQIPQIVEGFEESVRALSAEAESLYSSASNKKKDGWTDACSKPSGAQCNTRFGNSDDCDCDGRKVNMNKYSIRTPDKLDCRIVEADKVNNVLEDLLDVYKSNADDQEELSLQYFGSEDGVFHVFPSFDARDNQNQCSSYDPRRRPWYVAASSGPKRVVLVIDRSGSMQSSNRIQLARDAAISVIEGLTFNDYAAVVGFDDAIIVSGDLIRATSENKEMLQDWVDDKITANGLTDFYLGFQKAFEILDGCSGQCQDVCRSAILFLTDGENSGQDPNDLISDYRNDHSETDIFTFTLGDGASKDLPREIAEDNNGLYTHIPDGGDLISAMGSYYQYYAVGIAGDANKDMVRWTEPYESFSGLGPMMTAVQPIYDRSENPPIFLGVVGIDLTACNLFESYDASDILNDLRSRSSECPRWKLTKSDVRTIGERQIGFCGNAKKLENLFCFVFGMFGAFILLML